MGKYKTGIGRLLSAMKKNIREVNDQEICRRLEILMHSEKEDMNIGLVKRILESSPYELDPKEVPEPFSQYVKHYFYMLSREARIMQKEGIVPKLGEASGRKKNSSKKASARAGGTAAKKSAAKKRTGMPASPSKASKKTSKKSIKKKSSGQ